MWKTVSTTSKCSGHPEPNFSSSGKTTVITDFKNKTAVLTGAGSGFGLECARVGARLGMNLVLADVQQDALDRAAAEMQDAGAQVLAIRVDVSNADAMQALGQAVQARFGAPHFVFNNAGVGCGGLIWENTLQDWNWVLGVNVMGVVHGVRVFTPMMLEAARQNPGYQGHIVNTASMAGLVNAPNMGVYNVSKHAVVALSETLYQDLPGHGPDWRQRAVPVLRADRHLPQRTQSTARPGPGRRQANQEPAHWPGDERQGGEFRQGHGCRCRQHGVRGDRRQPVLHLQPPQGDWLGAVAAGRHHAKPQPERPVRLQTRDRRQPARGAARRLDVGRCS